MSLADTLSRLATSEPLAHVCHVQRRPLLAEQMGGGEWQDMPDPRSCRITFDETTRPYASATLTWAARDFDHWDYFDPRNLDERPRLRLSCGYRWPLTGDEATEQTATVIVTEIEEADATVTVTAESDETLLDADYVRPGRSYSVPTDATDIANIWATAALACLPLWPVPIRDHDPIPSLNLDAVRALDLAPGDAFADWLWSLADTAGLWLHSDQSPTSTGGLTAITRPDLGKPSVDLSSTSRTPILLRRRRVRSLDEYAGAVDITVRWTEGGIDQELSRRYAARGAMPHVVQRDLRLRPPLRDGIRTLPEDWPPGRALVDRMSQRGLVESLDARACYWLRPRDTIRTDSGRLLIRSVAFDVTTGLMTLTARPY